MSKHDVIIWFKRGRSVRVEMGDTELECLRQFMTSGTAWNMASGDEETIISRDAVECVTITPAGEQREGSGVMRHVRWRES